MSPTDEPTRHRRPGLWLAAAVGVIALAAASLAGVALVGGSDDGADSDDAAADAPAVLAPGADLGADAALRDPPPPTTAPPAAGAALGTPRDPGPVRPPAPGRYTYQRTAGNRTGRATTEIAAGPGGAQLHTFRGQENTFVNTVRWSPDAVQITSATYTFAGDDGETTGDCDWAPDIRELALPLRAGSTWDVGSRCTIDVDGQPVTIERSGSAEVVGLARVKVAGQILDTWEIRRSEESRTTSSRGTLRTRTETTEWFSPRHGLRVRLDGHAVARTTAAGRSRDTDSTISEVLVDLDPA